MPENYQVAITVEDFLNNYLFMHDEIIDFPTDEELEVMYDTLEQQVSGGNYVVAQVGNLLWLFLIGSLYRRFPYYRRRRGRRRRGRRIGRQSYGY